MAPKRDHLVDVALRLFHQNGFHAISIDTVYKTAGTTKTTLYKHFESKDDLARVVVEKHDLWWRKTFQEEIARRGGEDPIQRLRAAFDVLRDWFVSYDFKGCLFISAVSSYPDPKHQVHCAAKANVDAIRGVIERLAKQAGIANAVQFAERFNLIIEGTIVMGGFECTGAAADIGASLADILIEKALAEGR